MSFFGSLQSFQSAWQKVMQAFSSVLYVLSRCCILSADYQCLLMFTLAQTRTVARVQLGIRAFNSTVYQDTHLCTCKHKSWLADIFSLHYSLSLLSCPLSPLHYLSFQSTISMHYILSSLTDIASRSQTCLICTHVRLDFKS